MIVTAEQLAAAMAIPLSRAEKWAGAMSAAMAAYEIDNHKRIAAFLAQVGHESGRLVYTREIWGPTKQQLRYERNHAAPWPPTPQDQTNRLAFALGNSQTGDGSRYRGRGLIQITGRDNYRQAGQALGIDLEASPDTLELPEFAAMSAAWYWDSRRLNQLADVGKFDALTKAINGGLNGQADRVALHQSAQRVFA